MLKVLIVDDEAVVRRGIMLGMDWAAMGCVVGLCLVRSKVLGSILTVLAIFSSLVGLMSLVLLGLLQNPMWIRLLLTILPAGIAIGSEIYLWRSICRSTVV